MQGSDSAQTSSPSLQGGGKGEVSLTPGKVSSGEALSTQEEVNPTPQIYFFHPDHLGTATMLSDANGDPYQFFLNLPFGETMTEQTNGAYNNPYKFNGKELDEETGYYYYGARYYNPRTSVWLSVDPLAELTFDPYGYTNNNPINLIDPTGMSAEEDGTDPPSKLQRIWRSIFWSKARRDATEWRDQNKPEGVLKKGVAGDKRSWQVLWNTTSDDGQQVDGYEKTFSNDRYTTTDLENDIRSFLTSSSFFDNFVLEISSTQSIGIQGGGKWWLVDVSGGLLTADIGTTTFNLNPYNGRSSLVTFEGYNKKPEELVMRNYLEGSVGLGVKKSTFSLGGEVYSEATYNPNSRDFIDAYFKDDRKSGANGHVGWKHSSSSLEADYWGFETGAGIKALIGVDVNIKIGWKK